MAGAALSYSDFMSGRSDAEFISKMSCHSFVVLVDDAPGEVLYARFVQLLERFLQTTPAEDKALCVGPIFANERGTPLWNVGYEKSNTRECWRFPTAKLSLAGHSYDAKTRWPGGDGGSNDATAHNNTSNNNNNNNNSSSSQSSNTFRQANLELLQHMRDICDRALSVCLGNDSGLTNDDDLNIMHAFHYPNTTDNGFAPQLPGILVKQHTDASLFVAEFVPHVRGLEVLDQASREWLMVEDLFTPGRDVVVFAGEGIELLRGIMKHPVPACVHRVAESPGHARSCVIFEQKYKDHMAKGKALLRADNERAVAAAKAAVPPLVLCGDNDNNNNDDGDHAMAVGMGVAQHDEGDGDGVIVSASGVIDEAQAAAFGGILEYYKKLAEQSGALDDDDDDDDE